MIFTSSDIRSWGIKQQTNAEIKSNEDWKVIKTSRKFLKWQCTGELNALLVQYNSWILICVCEMFKPKCLLHWGSVLVELLEKQIMFYRGFATDDGPGSCKDWKGDKTEQHFHINGHISPWYLQTPGSSVAKRHNLLLNTWPKDKLCKPFPNIKK